MRFSEKDVDDMFYTCTTFFAHRWQLSIVIYLFSGPKHFGEILKFHPGLSKKVLSSILRKLESKGIVTKKSYDDGQITRTLYSLTESGLELEKILDSIYEWGQKHSPKDEEGPQAHLAPTNPHPSMTES